jgi:hypothetical protein
MGNLIQVTVAAMVRQNMNRSHSKRLKRKLLTWKAVSVSCVNKRRRLKNACPAFGNSIISCFLKSDLFPDGVKMFSSPSGFYYQTKKLKMLGISQFILPVTPGSQNGRHRSA